MNLSTPWAFLWLEACGLKLVACNLRRLIFAIYLQLSLGLNTVWYDFHWV